VLPALSQVKSPEKMKESPLEREIVANEKQMLDLSALKDLEAYGRRLPDDALGVYSDGYASKADVLGAINGMSDLHYSMDNIRVVPVDDTAGLIVYRITQDWIEGGKRVARQYSSRLFGKKGTENG
jgi:Domain of unknown function (DUF4440)